MKNWTVFHGTMLVGQVSAEDQCAAEDRATLLFDVPGEHGPLLVIESAINCNSIMKANDDLYWSA